jgi:hypothetical protein
MKYAFLFRPPTAGEKEKHISYNTAYLVTAFYKSLHPNCYRNFRYAETLTSHIKNKNKNESFQ